MIVYQGSVQDFKNHVINNQIADIMKKQFMEFSGRRVGRAEYNSWNNSCRCVKDVIELAGLKDNRICLEYEVPYNTGRIDCMLFGKGQDNKAYTVLMELKQWSEVSEIDDEDNVVETRTGGGIRKVAHPSQQVEGYHNHLISFVQVFEIDKDFDLYSCSYCHNYKREPGRGLFAEKFNHIIDKFPVYTKEDIRKLADKLNDLLAKGDGFEIFNRFMQSPVRPSKQLLKHTAMIIEGNKAVFSLLNEQLVAKNVIMSKVRKADRQGLKSVVVVQGGPGTGKTVIALNILAELARKNKSVFYGCKSKPFREALQKMVGPRSRILFSNLSRFLPSKVKKGAIDVVIIDEAHRIGKKSNSQFTKAKDRTDIPQIDQIICCAKTSVFFIDDNQNVRSQEVGSSEMIKEAAERYHAVYESVELFSQFRCAGSDNYLDWLEYVLGYQEKPVDLSKDDRFKFKIFDNPNKLYEVIKRHEMQKPNSARLVAGYCWPWSKKLNNDGSLIKDVVIPEHNFAMPWEARDNYTGGHLQRNIPKWFQWAYNTGGVEQVGCIYTAQGFEFDYIGVIVGPDIKYDKTQNRLVYDSKAVSDPTLRRSSSESENYIKNIYRVLMTRGMKGCYVYFCNKKVEAYFKKHIQGDPSFVESPILSDVISEEERYYIKIEPFIETPLQYTQYLPVYSLEAACGGFGKGLAVENEGWIKVDNIGSLRRNMFVVKAFGKSMEPGIPDGSYCVFRTSVVGSRKNKIVLVQHNGVFDSETGCQYSIKKYTSKKKYNKDGTEWEHEQIVLKPTNQNFEPIIINNAEELEFIVIGEFISVLK